MIDQGRFGRQVGFEAGEGEGARKRRFGSLAGIGFVVALAGAFIGALMMSPDDAAAQGCTATTASGTTMIACNDSQATTNTTAGATPVAQPNTFRTWDYGTNESAQVAAGQSYTVNGLAFTTTGAGNFILLENDGSVSSSVSGLSALAIMTADSNIYYVTDSHTGTVSATNTGGTGAEGLVISSGGGNVYMGYNTLPAADPLSNPDAFSGSIGGTSNGLDVNSGGGAVYILSAGVTYTGGNAATPALAGNGVTITTGGGNVGSVANVATFGVGGSVATPVGSITGHGAADADIAIAAGAGNVYLDTSGTTLGASSPNTIGFGVDITSANIVQLTTGAIGSSGTPVANTGVNIIGTNGDVTETANGAIYAADHGINISNNESFTGSAITINLNNVVQTSNGTGDRDAVVSEVTGTNATATINVNYGASVTAGNTTGGLGATANNGITAGASGSGDAINVNINVTGSGTAGTVTGGNATGTAANGGNGIAVNLAGPTELSSVTMDAGTLTGGNSNVIGLGGNGLQVNLSGGSGNFQFKGTGGAINGGTGTVLGNSGNGIQVNASSNSNSSIVTADGTTITGKGLGGDGIETNTSGGASSNTFDTYVSAGTVSGGSGGGSGVENNNTTGSGNAATTAVDTGGTVTGGGGGGDGLEADFTGGTGNTVVENVEGGTANGGSGGGSGILLNLDGTSGSNTNGNTGSSDVNGGTVLGGAGGGNGITGRNNGDNTITITQEAGSINSIDGSGNGIDTAFTGTWTGSGVTGSANCTLATQTGCSTTITTTGGTIGGSDTSTSAPYVVDGIHTTASDSAGTYISAGNAINASHDGISSVGLNGNINVVQTNHSGVPNPPTINYIQGGNDGIFAETTGSGASFVNVVTQTGAVVGGVTGNGIEAVATGTGGSVVVNAQGNIQVGDPTPVGGYGLLAVHSNVGNANPVLATFGTSDVATIDYSTNDGIRAATAGTGAINVWAGQNADDGLNGGTACTGNPCVGNISVTGIGANGITAFTNNPLNAGTVNVTFGGTIYAPSGAGIVATTVGTGNVNVTTLPFSVIGGNGTAGGVAAGPAPSTPDPVTGGTSPVAGNGIDASIQSTVALASLANNVNVNIGGSSLIFSSSNGVSATIGSTVGILPTTGYPTLTFPTTTEPLIVTGNVTVAPTTQFLDGTCLTAGSNGTCTGDAGYGASGDGNGTAANPTWIVGVNNGILASEQATFATTGNVSVTTGNFWNVIGTSTDGIGIDAFVSAPVSFGSVNVTTGTSNNIQGTTFAIFAQGGTNQAGDSTPVNVQVAGGTPSNPTTITATANGAPGVGIGAFAENAPVNVQVADGVVNPATGVVNATADQTNISADQFGIEALTKGLISGGNVSVSVGTFGDGSTITETPGGTGFTAGILAAAEGPNGSVSVTDYASIDDPFGEGIHAAITNPTNSGNVTVYTNAPAITGVNNGIFAGTEGSGYVSVTTAGSPANTISGGANGIVAAIVNPTNGSTGVTVNATGAITGSGAVNYPSYPLPFNSPIAYNTVSGFLDPAEAVGATSVTGYGIYAFNAGLGGVSVNAGIGGGAASTIAAGSVGILAFDNNAGSNGNIYVDNADAITIEPGTVTPLGGGGSVAGIWAETAGSGMVTVTNNGAIAGDDATDTLFYGIIAFSQSANSSAPVSITSNAAVAGADIGLLAQSNDVGSASVTTNPGGTVTGVAYGIAAISGANSSEVVGGIPTTYGGNVSVMTGDNVTGGTNGILAETGGTGTVTVTTSGGTTGITATGAGGVGIDTNSVNGNTYITANNLVSGGTLGASGSGTGIAATVTGAGSIVLAGGGSVTGGNAGIEAIETATATGGIQITGSLSATGDNNGTALADVGIDAEIENSADTQSIIVNGTGTISGGLNGLVAETVGTGNISISNTGPVTGRGLGGTGIFAQIDNATSAGTVYVAPGGAVSGGYGIIAETNGSGSVTVSTDVTVTGTNDDGIRASSTSGPTVVDVVQGTVMGATNGIHAFATTGDVEVINNGTVTGGADDGIRANTGGAGTVFVTTNGNVSTTGGDGINAYVLGGGSTGSITVDVTNGLISSAHGNGIHAFQAGTGGINVAMTGGSVGTSGTPVGGQGIRAVDTGASGDVNVGVGGGTSVWADGNGVDAQVRGGTGNVTVTNDGNVTGGIGGNADGIRAVNTGLGSVTVQGSGNATGDGDGVDALIINPANHSNVLEDMTGTITGTDPGSGPADYGINARTNGGGNVTVEDDGPTSVTGTLRVGDDGIDAITTGGNGNVIVAPSATGTVSGATGINASAVGTGYVNVLTPNSVTGTLGDGIDTSTATASTSPLAIGFGNVVEANAPVFGTQNGIFAQATGAGTVWVTTAAGPAGVVAGDTATTGAVGTAGIKALSNGGNVLVTPGYTVDGVNGIIANSATGGTGGGYVNVVTTANGNVTGHAGDGIDSNSGSATSSPLAPGSVSTLGFGNVVDVNAPVKGTVNGIKSTAVLGGSIIVTGSGTATVTGGTGTGIIAAVTGATTGATTGNVLVTPGATVSGATGINASTTDGGWVNVLTVATVTGTAGDGIDTTTFTATSSPVAPGTVSTLSFGNVVDYGAAVSGTVNGIDANATGAGNVLVTGTGTVTGTTGTGIIATSHGGNVLVTAGNTVTGATGINASTTDGGWVNVLTVATVTGTAGDGIFTSSGYATSSPLDVDFGNVVLIGADVTGSHDGVSAIATGIGDVLVQNGTLGSSPEPTVTGQHHDGIDARSFGGGEVEVLNFGAVDGAHDGVHAYSGGGAIDIVNETAATITATYRDGIDAWSSSCGAFCTTDDVYVENDGTVTAGTYGDGISAGNGGAGDVTVLNNAGAVINTSGLFFTDGIDARSLGGGAVLVQNQGVINGDAGIHAFSAGGPVVVNNFAGGEIYASGDGISAWEAGVTTNGVTVTNGCDGTTPCGGTGITPLTATAGYIGYEPTGGTLPSVDIDNVFTVSLGTIAANSVGGEGIHAGTSGVANVAVQNYAGSVISSDGTGIDTRDVGAAGAFNFISVRNDAGAYIYSGGGSGIRARSNNGAVLVENEGTILAQDDGVYARSNAVGTASANLVTVYNGDTNANAIIGVEDGAAISANIYNAASKGGIYVENDGVFSPLANFESSNYSTPSTSEACGVDGVTCGGVYSLDGSAVRLTNLSTTSTTFSEIANFGTMIGAGTFADPVIRTVTAAGGEGVFIYNAGSLGGADFRNWVVDASTAGFTAAYGNAAGDNPGVAGFGGQFSYYITGPALSAAAAAAAAAPSDIVLRATGGPVALENVGAMYGRVLLTTTGAGSGAAEVGNYIDNEFYWATSGTSTFYGGPNDEIYNDDFIQTAFNPAESPAGTTVGANGLNNYNTAWLGLNQLDNLGDISLQNGNAGDTLFMGVTGGSLNSFFYHGYPLSGTVTSPGDFDVDTYLTGLAPGGTPCLTATTACSDMIIMSTGATGTAAVNVSGLTLINVNNTNLGAGGYAPTGIPVVYFSGLQTGTGFDPTDQLIKNNFALDPLTPGYTTAYGAPVIQDGVFDYALGERPGINDPDNAAIVLFGFPGIAAEQLPTLMTAMQNIWQIEANSYTNRMTDLRDSWAGSGWPAQNATKSGLWLEVVGNETTRSDAVNPVVGGVFGSPISFDTAYTQGTYLLLGGFDIGTSLSANSAIMAGVLGGYASSELDYRDGGTRASLSGGTVGAYATYVSDGFFIDALAKADFLAAGFSSPGLTSSSPSALEYGVMADAGYHFDWQSIFIEPVITGEYLHSSMGAAVLDPGVVATFASNDSFYGAIGGRVGTTLYSGPNYGVQASVLGRVWNDFGGDNSVTIASTGPNVNVSDPFSKLWGEVIGKVDLTMPASNLNGFVSGGVDFNGQWTSLTGKVGLRMSF